MRLGKRSTEAQWLACTEPGNLLPFLRRKLGTRATDRKLLLFACACWRRVSSRLTDPRPRAAVEVVEQFLEGSVGLPEVNAALADAEAAVGQDEGDSAGFASRAATYAALAVARRPPDNYDSYAAACDTFNHAAVATAYAVYEIPGREVAAWGTNLGGEHRRQCDLLRCIFGNPFHPTHFIDPELLAWNEGLVRRLAEAAYEERALPEGTLDLDLLAILADALEDAGCADAELLGHLRGPGPHVRGCWALDVVLGKE
jgi:hypothetical protein